MGQEGSKPEQQNDGLLPADAAIPQKMRALRLIKHVSEMKAEEKELKECFEVAEIDVPEPGEGEVLVRIECSPINPSDLSTLRGSYNSKQKEPLPCLLGFEASGTVVKSGGGIVGWMMGKRRVGVISGKGGRMWAEYAVVPAVQCVALPDDVSFEEGCSCFVNPLTALAFIDIAKAENATSFAFTAASSALGKMTLRLAERNGIQMICIVRRPAQVEELKQLGAKHIICTGNENWGQEFSKLCTDLNCTLAFDAVAGELTGLVLEHMPAKSAVHVYGGLSEQKVSSIRPTDLIFMSKKVVGFWLTSYLGQKSMLGKKAMLDQVAALLKTDLKTDVRVSYPLENAVEAIRDYSLNMSSGKVCFAPSSKQIIEHQKPQQQPQQQQQEQQPQQ